VATPCSRHVRPGLLRDRDDDHGRRAARHRAHRLRGVPGLPAPGRHDHPVGPDLHQDGADRPARLRPDARAQVGDRDGRVLQLDGRLQQLRDRAGGQVHAGRRPHPRLPAAARGAHARHPAAALDDPRRPALGWRKRYNAEGTEELRAASGPTATRRSTSPGPGTQPVPDATGLELLAQELAEAHGDEPAVQGTEHFRGKGALHIEPARSAPRSRSCAARATASWPACTASTTTPRSRGSACSTSSSTWTRWTA
jgi:hypothetical protein